MCKNFGKLHKKCSISLVDSNSEVFWLKENQVGLHKGNGGLLRSYNIKISNGKKIPVTDHDKNQSFF